MSFFGLIILLTFYLDYRMGLKSAGNYVVATDTYLAVGFLNCLLFTFLPVHTKETMLCYFFRSLKLSIDSEMVTLFD